MAPLLTLLPKLVPVVLRHLSGYLELAAADAGDLLRGVVRRLVAAAVALLGDLHAVDGLRLDHQRGVEYRMA